MTDHIIIKSAQKRFLDQAKSFDYFRIRITKI